MTYALWEEPARQLCSTLGDDSGKNLAHSWVQTQGFFDGSLQVRKLLAFLESQWARKAALLLGGIDLLAKLLKARWIFHEVVDDCRESDSSSVRASANVGSYSVEHRAMVHLARFL
jgi:hypothetical protein